MKKILNTRQWCTPARLVLRPLRKFISGAAQFWPELDLLIMKTKRASQSTSDLHKIRKYARAVAVLAPVILTGGIGAFHILRGANLTWTGLAGNSLWNLSSVNWNDGTNNVAYTDGSAVTFSSTGTNNITVSNSGAGVTPASITISGSGSWAIGGEPIKGSGAVTMSSTGSLTLTGSNTFTGGVAMNAGTLGIGTNTALGTGTLSISGAGVTIQGVSNPVSLTNAIAANADFNFAGNQALTFSGAMALPASATRTITLNNTALVTVGAVNGTASNLVVGGTGNLAVNGIIATTTGSVTMNGSGTLTLAGTNTFTGGVNLNSGVLVVNAGGALGSTGTFNINGGALDSTAGAAVTVNSGITTKLNADFAFNGTQGLIFAGTTNLGTNAGAARTITVNGTGALTFSGTVSNGTNGTTPTISIVKAGNGTLALNGANTFTGGVTVNAGTLSMGTATAIGTGGTLTMAGGTLQSTASGISVTNPVSVTGDFAIGGTLPFSLSGTTTLTGNRTITVNNTSATATALGAINGSNTNLTVTGPGLLTINGLIGTGSGAVTMNGTGTLALNLTSGTSAFSGGTTLNSGTLAIQTTGALGSGPFTINGGKVQANTALLALGVPVAANGDFAVGGTQAFTFGGAVNLNASRTITLSNTASTAFTGGINGTGDNLSIVMGAVANTTISSAINIGSGSLSVSGTGTLLLSGANSFTGGVTVNSGTLTIGNASALGTGTLTANGGTITAAGTQTISNPVSATGDFAIGGSSAMTFSNTISLSASRVISVNNNAATTFNTISGTNTDLTIGGTGTGAITMNGPINLGTGALSFSGTGTVNLTGTNSYTGMTNINSGTVVVTNVGALGPGDMTLGGNLQFNLGTNNLTYGGAISSGNTAGNLIWTGSGTLTLSGNSSYTGGIFIKNGAFSVSALNNAPGTFGNGNLGNGAGTITMGDAALNNMGTLIYTGTTGFDTSFNPVTLVGTKGGTIKTDSYLIFSSNLGPSSNILGLSGTAPLTIDAYSAGGGTVEFAQATNFTGSMVLTNGSLTMDILGPATTTGKSVTLPAGGSSAGIFTVNGGNTQVGTAGNTSTGTFSAPDLRSIIVPAAGGTVGVGGGETWYVGGTLTDVAGGQPFVKTGSGSLIINGKVTLNQTPVFDPNGGGTLGFANTSTVAGSANQFLFNSNSNPIYVPFSDTLLTHVNSLGNAKFQLDGGALALVGEVGATSAVFGYNVPVLATGDGSSVAAYNVSGSGNYEAKMGNLDLQGGVVFGITQGRVSFTTTTIDTADVYTFNASAQSGLQTGDLSMGAINTNGNNTPLVKIGDGNLSFDNATVTNLHSSGLDIQQGRVQLVNSISGPNPLGTDLTTGKSTAITFDDNGFGVTAGLVLSSSSASGTVTYDNAITVNSNASISAAQVLYGGSVAGTGAINVTLTGPISIATDNGFGGRPVLSLSSSGTNYNLFVNSQITSGDVAVTGGKVTLGGANTLGNFSVTGGTATVTGASTYQSITTSGTTGAILNLNAPATIGANGSLNVAGSSKLISTANLTVNSSATVNVTQSGNLTFTGVNYHGPSINVDATGATSTAATFTSSGTTNLNNATIAIKPLGNYPTFDQLTEKYYSGADSTNSLTPGDPVFLPTQTATTTGTLSNFATPGGLNFQSADLTSRSGGLTQNFRASWSGFFRVTTPGTYTFGTASDDGSALFIDLNKDGTYSASDEIVNNNAYQGVIQKLGTVTFATAGDYPIFIGYYDGTGGYSMEAKYGAGTVSDFGSLTDILSTTGEGFYSLAPGGGGNINVTDGTLSAGAITGGQAVTLGGASTAILNLTNTTGTSDTVKLTNNGTTGTLNVAAGQTFKITNLDVKAGTTLNLTGGGTVQLAGANDSTFTGAVNVSAGALNMGTSVAKGTLQGTVTAQTGGTVAGFGTIGTLVGSGGTIAPGTGTTASPALATTTTTFNTGTTLALTLSSATLYSQLSASSSITLTSNINLTITLGFDPADTGTQFIFLTRTGTGSINVGSNLFVVNGAAIPNNGVFSITSNSITQPFRLTYSATSVILTTIPEPTPAMSSLLGLGLLLGLQRFRRPSRA